MVLNGSEAGMERENAVLEWQKGVDGTVRRNRMPVVRKNDSRWSRAEGHMGNVG
jgi:hypothetical protein